ncbi:MAG TPA: hypothetical protein VFT02_08095, partial [Pyrinomonadaceae bacterium]|nr:hypothetical protein [Pyrinomonadaceae bacterium]
MTERSIIDQLDDAITALLAQRKPQVSESDSEWSAELAELVAVARELRGLPSEQFRAALKEQLGGKEVAVADMQKDFDDFDAVRDSKPMTFKREGFHTITPYI